MSDQVVCALTSPDELHLTRCPYRTDCLNTQLKNEGAKPRWSQLDAYILVHKYVHGFVALSTLVDLVYRVDSLKVNDDSEIDWKKLPDEHWNIWSAHTLQRRWLTMKRSVKGYEDMSHTGSSAATSFTLSQHSLPY